MLRAVLGYLVSLAAVKLAELAARLLRPPGQAGHTSTDGASARGGTAATAIAPEVATLTHDRFIRDLPSLQHAKADAVLGYALGAEGSAFIYGHFTKVATGPWHQ